MNAPVIQLVVLDDAELVHGGRRCAGRLLEVLPLRSADPTDGATRPRPSSRSRWKACDLRAPAHPVELTARA